MDNIFSNKIVFYHVPKNAGTAIFKGMNDCKNFRRAHRKINHVKITEYPPGLFETPFAIIRHPYDRFVSAFYHMNDISNPSHFYHNALVSDYRTLINLGINMNVFNINPNLFLDSVFDSSHRFYKISNKILDTFDIFKSQFYWLKDYSGKRVYPRLTLLNYDNLQNEFKWVEKKTGCIINWPEDKQANRRITKNVTQLTDKSKKIIQKLYYDDFKYFGFEK